MNTKYFVYKRKLDTINNKPARDFTLIPGQKSNPYEISLQLRKFYVFL
jgi:hypothetical protein